MTASRNFKPITEKKYKKFAFLWHITQESQKTANVWDPHFTDKKTEDGDNKEQVHPENLLPFININFFP